MSGSNVSPELAEKLSNLVTNFDETLKTEREKNSDLTDGRIKALKDDLDKDIKEIKESVRQINVPGLEEEAKRKKFNVGKAMKAIAQDDFSDAGYEKEVFIASQKADTMNTNTGQAGAFHIPAEFARELLIMPSIANTVMKDLGATFLNDLVGDLEIPEVTNRPVLKFNKDGDPALNQVINSGKREMRPNTGNILIKMSNKLLKQTDGFVSTFTTKLMTEGITEGMDKASVIGSGQNNEPLGILLDPAIGVTNSGDANGERFTFVLAAALEAEIQDRNFLKNGGGGLLTHPRIVHGMRTERFAQFSGDTAGEPLIMPLTSIARLSEELDKNIRATTNVPNDGSFGTSDDIAKVIVGGFNDYWIGVWGGVDIRRSTEAGASFENNETWLVAFVDMDTHVSQPSAFQIFNGGRVSLAT